MTITGKYTATDVRITTHGDADFQISYYRVTVMVEGKKAPVEVSFAVNADDSIRYVNVNTNSTMSKAYNGGRSFGKDFQTAEAALANYKEGGKVHGAVKVALELLNEAYEAMTNPVQVVEEEETPTAAPVEAVEAVKPVEDVLVAGSEEEAAIMTAYALVENVHKGYQPGNLWTKTTGYA